MIKDKEIHKVFQEGSEEDKPATITVSIPGTGSYVFTGINNFALYIDEGERLKVIAKHDVDFGFKVAGAAKERAIETMVEAFITTCQEIHKK